MEEKKFDCDACMSGKYPLHECPYGYLGICDEACDESCDDNDYDDDGRD